MKTFLLITGLLILFAAEILRVYFIMPFPGSQYNYTIDLAYWIANNITWIRIVALLMIALPVTNIFRKANPWKKIATGAILLLYGVIFFMFNFRFEADKMFYQPSVKNMAPASENTVNASKLVIGVTINGEAKAYPVQLIGYHHQVRDTIGNTPVMVTYCTVCRTGRVFSPVVNGQPENFRLVGMDHFNAMFEDGTTKSWWQQATGVAITGKLKGRRLPEIPSEQMTLASWLGEHPNSLVMQPDTLYKKDYDDLAEYDKGTLKSSLEKRDSASWKFKSWVVGVVHGGNAKAYDWNALTANGLLQDSLPGLPLLITLANDTASFYVLNRTVAGNTLTFIKDTTANVLRDTNTNSVWTIAGVCTAGLLKDAKLRRVQSYQEFWHSWQTFHPQTKRYP